MVFNDQTEIDLGRSYDGAIGRNATTKFKFVNISKVFVMVFKLVVHGDWMKPGESTDLENQQYFSESVLFSLLFHELNFLQILSDN